MILGQRSVITLKFKNRVSSFIPLTPRTHTMSTGLQTNASSGNMTAATSQGAATRTPPLLSDYLPISVLTDSYKATHFLQSPEAKKMVAVSRDTISMLIDY